MSEKNEEKSGATYTAATAKTETKAATPALSPFEMEIAKLVEKSVKGADGKLNVEAAKEAVRAMKSLSVRLSGAIVKTLEAQKIDLDSQIAVIKAIAG